MDEDKRSFRTDASGALRLGRQMLSSYFDRRNDAPAAIIFITDQPSNINVNEIVKYVKGKGGSVILSNGKEILVSASKKSDLLSYFK